jgi:hypothetical protein
LGHFSTLIGIQIRKRSKLIAKKSHPTDVYVTRHEYATHTRRTFLKSGRFFRTVCACVSLSALSLNLSVLTLSPLSFSFSVCCSLLFFFAVALKKDTHMHEEKSFFLIDERIMHSDDYSILVIVFSISLAADS